MTPKHRAAQHGQVRTDHDAAKAPQRGWLARWRWLVLISCTLLCGLEPTMAQSIEPAQRHASVRVLRPSPRRSHERGPIPVLPYVGVRSEVVPR